MEVVAKIIVNLLVCALFVAYIFFGFRFVLKLLSFVKEKTQSVWLEVAIFALSAVIIGISAVGVYSLQNTILQIDISNFLSIIVAAVFAVIIIICTFAFAKRKIQAKKRAPDKEDS